MCPRRQEALPASLIGEAHALNTKGKHIIPIIDDAHLVPIEALRKLRLLLEDFPKNHNLILLGQSTFNTTLQLRVNDDIRTRITCSATLPRLAPEAITGFVRDQLDLVGLPHNTFTEAALNLIFLVKRKQALLGSNLPRDNQGQATDRR